MTPAAHQDIRTAWHHICTVIVADATPAEMWRCALAPAVLDTMRQVDSVARTGTQEGLRRTCQTWSQAYKVALRQLREDA